MKTLDLASSAQRVGRKTPWRDSLAAVWDRMMTSTSLYRWSVSNPLTRWITQRRARQVFDLMAGFVYSQVLLACVRLRILETVAERPRSLEELAQLTNLPVASLQRLLQQLARRERSNSEIVPPPPGRVTRLSFVQKLRGGRSRWRRRSHGKSRFWK